jgi:hypothetical protein
MTPGRPVGGYQYCGGTCYVRLQGRSDYVKDAVHTQIHGEGERRKF